jgi:hypothetical protein
MSSIKVNADADGEAILAGTTRNQEARGADPCTGGQLLVGWQG